MSRYAKGKERRCTKRRPGCLGIVCDRNATGCKSCYVYERKVTAATDNRASSDTVSERGDAREIAKTTSEQVRTLADLVRVCDIDLKVWEIERWVANKWEMGSKDDKNNPQTTPLFQVKVWLRARDSRIVTLETLQAALLSDIRAVVKKAPPRAKRQFVQSDWLFEFTPFDLHMGKYAWDEETVTNYDTDIAADLFNASLDFLLEQAVRVAGGKLSRVLFVVGNDVSHTDIKSGETTRGTRMDVDTRYIRVYRRICAIHRRAVNILRSVAPVDIVVVPGNHDELTAFHLGEILEAVYESDKHVTVDNTAKLRKYYEFGTNLFGFAHGDAERINELPLLMAREKPAEWARCASREWHIGHKHIAEKVSWREQDLFSDKGVRVRRLASLSAHDAWHTKHAYTDRRACDSFVFHRDAGFTNHLSFNCDHFTGKALSK